MKHETFHGYRLYISIVLINNWRIHHLVSFITGADVLSSKTLLLILDCVRFDVSIFINKISLCEVTGESLCRLKICQCLTLFTYPGLKRQNVRFFVPLICMSSTPL